MTDEPGSTTDDRPHYEELAPGALDDIGERRELRIAGIRLYGRRRRPSGEKSALPRTLQWTGWAWLAAGLSVAVIWTLLFVLPGTTEWWTSLDHRVLDRFVDIRNDTLTDIMNAIHVLGSVWFYRPLRWIIILLLVVFRRWRILIGVLVAFIVVDAIVRVLVVEIGRPRPLVDIIGDWSNYSHPSAPAALLAVTLVVAGYALIPKGVWRNRWFVLAVVLVAALGISLMYLGTSHPSDVFVGAVLGPVVGVLVIRLVAPESVFPVTYRRGRAAHLDVTGERGEAIKKALQEQLGVEVLSIEPFGMEGSGGSTPLRIKLAGDPDTYCFAKLYASSHLRADRWYKAARTVLYGSLEDEVRFTSVRRLVEYEDYILLKLKEAGLPSPEPFGFVEITPEREYMMVTEFLDGAKEMGDTEVTDEVIDDSLLSVRRLWDAGLAHRDIKPANVMVRDGKVVLIDPAFATVRPSPWRQAVDLANMMIILALRTSPEQVYERALKYFTPDEIAEAFAATKGVTIPSQSRSSLALVKRNEGVDIVQQFRELSPYREPISVQRWSTRRIALALGAVLLFAILLSLLIDNITGAGFI
jgi:membrane-associated phospholipid phosphatase/tRNA A-37 threonylcarbamoyl transferase component Bud32